MEDSLQGCLAPGSALVHHSVPVWSFGQEAALVQNAVSVQGMVPAQDPASMQSLALAFALVPDVVPTCFLAQGAVPVQGMVPAQDPASMQSLALAFALVPDVVPTCFLAQGAVPVQGMVPQRCLRHAQLGPMVGAAQGVVLVKLGNLAQCRAWCRSGGLRHAQDLTPMQSPAMPSRANQALV
jgi:hypothetical protein